MDYTYYLRTSHPPQEIERLIEGETAAAPWRFNPVMRPEPITVFDAPPGMRELVAEYYGFEPTVGVSVQLDKFAEDRRDRERQALDVLAALLRMVDGDLYADYYDGKPALLRRAGAITVDERWAASRPWVAAVLRAPTQTAVMPGAV